MKPKIPPIVLATVLKRSGHSLRAQARAADFDERHFRKLLDEPWDHWWIGKAEKWCSAYGLDFWNLELPRCRLRWDAKRDRKALMALLGGRASLIPELVRKLNADIVNGQVGT